MQYCSPRACSNPHIALLDSQLGSYWPSRGVILGRTAYSWSAYPARPRSSNVRYCSVRAAEYIRANAVNADKDTGCVGRHCLMFTMLIKPQTVNVATTPKHRSTQQQNPALIEPKHRSSTMYCYNVFKALCHFVDSLQLLCSFTFNV